MAYVITQGVVRQRWQRFIRDSGIALPIIAVIFIIIAALSASTHQGAGQSPYINPASSSSKPSLSTGSAGKSGSTGGGPGRSSPAAVSSATESASTPAMSLESLSSPSIVTPSTSGVTGGLGGGDISGASSASPSSSGSPSTSGSGSSGSGTSTSTPSVVCTNLLSLAQVCTACTPSLTIQPGQKALLSADGTCIAVN